MKSSLFSRLACLCLVVFAVGDADASPADDLPNHDDILLEPKLGEITLDSIFAKYKREMPSPPQPNQQGTNSVKVPAEDPSGFQWTGATKDGLRGKPKVHRFLGESLGEVLVSGSRSGTVARVTIAIYNRSGDGEMNLAEFNSATERWTGLISDKLGFQPQPRDNTGPSTVRGLIWTKGGVAWLLEASTAKADNAQSTPERPEFLRLRMAVLNSAAATPAPVNTRISVSDNVKIKDNGDIVIENLPMVDQGKEQYSAVSAIKRIARYYDIDVDEHELLEIGLAELVNATIKRTINDTNEDVDGIMGLAFKQLNKSHLRTTKGMAITFRQFQADVNAYNRVAKKEGKTTFDNVPSKKVVSPFNFFAEADADIYAKQKKEDPNYDRFTSKLQECLKRGILIVWRLGLGMFEESGLPRSNPEPVHWLTYSAGHTCLIIGYNPKTSEVIYSGTRGKENEVCRMPAINALCMTTAIYTIAPKANSPK